METTKYIWHNGAMIPWDQAMTHVMTHTLHYGAGAFEGVRAYKTDEGTAIFRLAEHTDRLLYSAKAIGMTVPYSKKELIEAQKKVVHDNQVDSCYIRPIIYYGYGKMGLNPIGAPVEVAIACWPWGRYLGGDMVRVKISDYIRIHPETSVTDAKINGHYVNSVMAALEVSRTDDFDEALFLDYEGNVAEGPGENVFLVKEGKIITPKLGKILAGITRSSVMQMAQDLGYEVAEETVSVEDIKTADECFFTGTAAEVTGISHLDDTVLNGGQMGPVTRKIKEEYEALIRGKREQYKEWLTLV